MTVSFERDGRYIFITQLPSIKATKGNIKWGKIIIIKKGLIFSCQVGVNSKPSNQLY